MRKFLRASLAFFFAFLIVHLWVWAMDHDLWSSRKAERKALHPQKTIKEIRQALDRDQLKDRENYGWVNRAQGRAKIPLHRAYYYYLRSLRH